MTQLICLVQRLYLGDEKRTLIKEGERFDVEATTAEVYIKGGIARPAEFPAEKQSPALAQDNLVTPAPESELPAAPDPEKPTKKKR
jgi:hypothetical protein